MRRVTAELPISWSHGEAVISPLAGMLRSARFNTGQHWVTPFAVAPWSPDDPAIASAPGHLRALGGEFVCLPFGSAALPPDAPDEWQRIPHAAPSPEHGDTAEQEWAVVEHNPASVILELSLPEPHPIARVIRTITGVEGEPALHFSVQISSRRDHASSFGIHPIFRLPTGDETLDIAVDHTTGHSYPGSIAGGSGLIRANTAFANITAAPGVTGPIDLSHLPLSKRPLSSTTEEVVQLGGARAPVVIRWSNGDGVTLDWDSELLPSVLLWLSDSHLTAPPWNGRYRGLGVEPLASAFDLPPEISAAENPLSRHGIATAIHLYRGKPFETQYRISAFHVMNGPSATI